MIIKSIIQVGNPIIRKRSTKIKSVNSPKIKSIIKDLVDSMRHYNLVGIAAPQIGHNLRIFATEIRTTKTRKIKDLDNLKIFINPVISYYSKNKSSGYEGCGSVAYSSIFGKVPRSTQIKIRATDENGKEIKYTARGLLARVIQHEFDHLNGIIFLDKIVDKKSIMSEEEYIKMIKKNKK